MTHQDFKRKNGNERLLGMSVSFVLCMSFFLASCSKSDMVAVIDSVLPEQETNFYKVSEEEAKEKLSAFMNRFDSKSLDEVSTRSSSTRTISNIQAYRVDKRKVSRFASEEKLDDDLSTIDTLLYLMNFENNSGFALVSADNRSKYPVLAIIDEGAMSLDDLSKSDNPGFILFFNQSIAYMLQDIADVKSREARAENENEIETRSQIWYTLPPRLKTKWGQRAPYNDYSPNSYPAGCVIIAFAQAISHFQTISDVAWLDLRPGFGGIGSSVLNWNQIITDCESSIGGYGKLNRDLTPTSADQVAHLVRYLGSNFNANYTSSGTSANSTNALNFVKSYLGLSSSTGFQSYSLYGVRDALVNYPNCLILSEGYAKKTSSGFLGLVITYSEGHDWIIDGSQYEQMSPGVNGLYVHCNWGWNGRCDGYYASDVFNTGNGPVFLDPNDAGGTEGYNFIYENKYAVLK